MVKSSLVVLFCAMLFIGGCSSFSCQSKQKECAYNVKSGCCSGALAEKCAKAKTCPKAAAATSSEPATCGSQTTK